MKACRTVKRQLTSNSSPLLARHLGKMLQGVKCHLNVQNKDLIRVKTEDPEADEAAQNEKSKMDLEEKSTKGAEEEDEFAFKPPPLMYPEYHPADNPFMCRPTTPHKNDDDEEPVNDDDEEEASEDEEWATNMPVWKQFKKKMKS